MSTYFIDVEPSFSEYEDYRLKTYLDEYILISFEGKLLGTSTDNRFIKTNSHTDDLCGIYDVKENKEIVPSLFRDCLIEWVSSQPYFIVEDSEARKGLYNEKGVLIDANEMEIQFITIKTDITLSGSLPKERRTHYLISTDKNHKRKIFYKGKIVSEDVQGFTMLEVQNPQMSKYYAEFIIIEKDKKKYLYHYDVLVSEIEGEKVNLIHYDTENSWFKTYSADKLMQGLFNEKGVTFPFCQQKLLCKFKGRENNPLIGVKVVNLYEGCLDSAFFIDKDLRFLSFASSFPLSKDTLIAFVDLNDNVVFFNDNKTELTPIISNIKGYGTCAVFKRYCCIVFSYESMDFKRIDDDVYL